MKDAYLDGVYVCSCCETRMSECKCPCDGWSCNNRIPRFMEKFLYDMGPIEVPTPFVRLMLPD